MTSKLVVTITPEESMALYTLAASEMRRPAEQVRWLLRQELLRRGLIEVDHEEDGEDLEQLEQGEMSLDDGEAMVSIPATCTK